MLSLSYMLRFKRKKLLSNSESQHHGIIVHQIIISVIFKLELYKVHDGMSQV